jgi:hypothetical protein
MNSNSAKNKQWASIYKTEKFIFLSTELGFRGSAIDPFSPIIFIDVLSSSEEVGEAVLKSLSNSRVLEEHEVRDFFRYENVEKNYEEWISKVMGEHDLSRKELFSNMTMCSLEVENEWLLIEPAKQIKLEEWVDLEGKEKKIPVDSSLKSLGDAIINCLGAK